MTETPSAETVSAGLYQDVQQFYGKQMQLLDDGDAAGWADSFTVDGTFQANVRPDPVVGREAIRRGAQQSLDRLAAEKLVWRHWFGMLTLAERPDGSVFARCYAQILESAAGGATTVRSSTVCEDVLVRDGGRWLVRSRHVRRDGIA